MSASAVEPVPQQLGEFTIEGELGRGGSGVVYAARWQDRAIALKVLRPDEAATPKERERFLGEARLLARVEHPGVVRVFGSGLLPDGRPYLAMERLTGAALAERLLMGRMAVGQALAIFDQLTAAVAALHGAGIVHRDIKPENIMLVDRGQRAVLLDFGIARGVDDAASTTTQLGMQRGTPAYMAPERFFGARATIGSDVYETAVVLYVMLTGHLPWRDPRNPQDRLEPRPPSALGVELPVGLERELMRALAPRPEGRPASIDELALAVRRHAWDGDTVRSAPATDPRVGAAAAAAPASTLRVRRPVVIGGVALGGAAIVVAALVVALGGKGRGSAAVVAGPADAGVVVVLPGGEAAVDAAPQGPGPEVIAVVELGEAVDAGARRAARGAGGGSSARSGSGAGAGTGAGTGSGAGTGAGSASGTGAGSASGAGAAAGAGAGSGAYDPAMPTCAKLFGLYCTDEFKATEGSMAGALCTGMQKTLADFRALPEEARRSQEKFCVDNYATMSGAVRERLRMWKAGLGPGQGGVPSGGDAGAP